MIIGKNGPLLLTVIVFYYCTNNVFVVGQDGPRRVCGYMWKWVTPNNIRCSHNEEFSMKGCRNPYARYGNDNVVSHEVFDCYCNGIHNQRFCAGQTLFVLSGRKMTMFGMHPNGVTIQRAQSLQYTAYRSTKVKEGVVTNDMVVQQMKKTDPIRNEKASMIHVDYNYYYGTLALLFEDGYFFHWYDHRFGASPKTITCSEKTSLKNDIAHDEEGGNLYFTTDNRYLVIDRFDPYHNALYVDGGAVALVLQGSVHRTLIKTLTYPEQGFMFLLWNLKTVLDNGTVTYHAVIDGISMDGDPQSKITVYTAHQNETLHRRWVQLEPAIYRIVRPNVLEISFWFMNFKFQRFAEIFVERQLTTLRWRYEFIGHIMVLEIQPGDTRLYAMTTMYYGIQKRVYYVDTESFEKGEIRVSYVIPARNSPSVQILNRRISQVIQGNLTPPEAADWKLNNTVFVQLFGIKKLRLNDEVQSPCSESDRGYCYYNCLASFNITQNTCRCAFAKNDLKNQERREESPICQKYVPGMPTIAPRSRSGKRRLWTKREKKAYCPMRLCSPAQMRKAFLTEVIIYVVIILALLIVILGQLVYMNQVKRN